MRPARQKQPIKKYMRILLLSPATISGKAYIRMCRNHRQAGADIDLWPPIDLAEIAAVLKCHGFDDLKIMDCALSGYSFDEMIAETVAFNPRLIIVHNISSSVSDDKKMARRIKASLADAHIAFYGIMATADPENFLSEDIRFAVRNEPEYTVLELVRCLKNSDLFSGVAGLSYYAGGVIRHNPDRPLVDNLDELPLPARDLIDNRKYILAKKNAPFTIIKVSRGCPYRCIYCSSSVFSRNHWRFRSPRSIVEEIKTIRRDYGINDFMFLSDTFTINAAVVFELCALIKKECPGISWICNSRTDTLTPGLASAMKEAGCWLVSLGIESGDEKVLKTIKKGATVSDALKSVAILRAAGIRSIGYYIFGLPGETRQSIHKTMLLSRKLDTNYAYFFAAVPFPGTEYFEISRAGRFSTEGGLTPDEVTAEIKRAYQGFYLRPSRIVRELCEIKRPADVVRYIRIGVRLFAGRF